MSLLNAPNSIGQLTAAAEIDVTKAQSVPLPPTEEPTVSEAGFPVETLPSVMREFVVETARALSAAPDFVALPALVAAGVAIGNAVRICMKSGWTEPAALYAAVIAPSGSLKSPALNAATAPVRDLNTSTRRTWTSDCTVERLAQLLTQYPRGLGIFRDELAGWVKSMNQYKSGKGADREFYLSAWSGQACTIDRKNGTELSLQRPFVSVVGGLPPEVLPELAKHVTDGDGFLERVLFASPDPPVARWSDATVSSQVRDRYQQLFTDLYAIPYSMVPVDLELTSEAREFFVAWHDDHSAGAEDPTLSPFLCGHLAKLKGYCGRLALIHTLCTNPQAPVVELGSITAAAAMVDYFKVQAAKVDSLRSRASGSRVERCGEEILRKLSGCRDVGMAKRELQRRSAFPSEIFNEALDQLISPRVRVKGTTVYLYQPTYRQPTPAGR